MASAWLWVAIAAVLVLATLLAWHFEKQHRKAVAAFAAARGWSYADRDDRYVHDLSGVPFGRGDNRRATNVIAGEFRGRPAAAFDYSYVTYTTDSKGRRRRRVHRFHVIMLGLPASLPTLQVTREGQLHRVGQLFGFTDIELESEDFNREFRVSSEDRKLAYDVLHPRTMQLLLSAGDWVWRIERDRILTWSSGRLDLRGVAPALEMLSAVVTEIPSFVWDNRAS